MPRRTLMAWAWTGLILLATLAPKQNFPRGDESRAVVVPNADKIVHAALFFGFGWLWARAGRRPTRSRMASVLAAGLALAVATEIGQGLPSIERDPDRLDALADAVGLVCGLGAAHLATSSRRDEGADGP